MVKRLHADAVFPLKGSEGAAGFDLVASEPLFLGREAAQNVTLTSGELMPGISLVYLSQGACSPAQRFSCWRRRLPLLVKSSSRSSIPTTRTSYTES